MAAKELVFANREIGRMPTIFAKRDGTIVGANKRRLMETPFFLMTNPPNNVISMSANASAPTATMRVSGEGPIQLTRMGIKRTGACKVMFQIQDGQDIQALMNAPVHCDAIFGSGGELYPLPEALYLDENRAVAVVLTDISGAPNSATLAAIGAKYRQLQNDQSLNRIKERLQTKLSAPYFYTFDNSKVTLAANESTQVEISIAQDHHFLIHQLSYVSTGTFAIDIVDVAKGESIINAPSGTHFQVPNQLLCGSGKYPFRLNEPVMVFAEQKLLVSLTDTSGSSNDVYLALGGQGLKTDSWS